MILFRDILKEAYGKTTQESDFIDADFQGTADVELDDEQCLDNGDGEKTANKELFKKRKVRPVANYNQT